MPGIYRAKSFQGWEARLRAGLLSQNEGSQRHPGTAEMMASEVIDVVSYTRLVDIIAFLLVMNKNLVLLSRGQRRDREPSRRFTGRTGRRLVLKFPLRWTARLIIGRCSEEVGGDIIYPVLERHGLPRWRHLRRHQPARWAVIQHYELWPTPLLDFSTSLRIAASFAFGLDPNRREGYLFDGGGRLSAQRPHEFQRYRTGDQAELGLSAQCGAAPPARWRSRRALFSGRSVLGDARPGLKRRHTNRSLPADK